MKQLVIDVAPCGLCRYRVKTVLYTFRFMRKTDAEAFVRNRQRMTEGLYLSLSEWGAFLAPKLLICVNQGVKDDYNLFVSSLMRVESAPMLSGEEQEKTMYAALMALRTVVEWAEEWPLLKSVVFAEKGLFRSPVVSAVGSYQQLARVDRLRLPSAMIKSQANRLNINQLC